MKNNERQYKAARGADSLGRAILGYMYRNRIATATLCASWGRKGREMAKIDISKKTRIKMAMTIIRHTRLERSRPGVVSFFWLGVSWVRVIVRAFRVAFSINITIDARRREET